jgi:hypothetical protein
MNTSNDKQPFKSSSFDTKNDQFGLEKPTKLSGYEQSANEALKLQLEDNQDTLCSNTSICLVELEASAWQPSNLGGRVSGVNPHTRKPTEEYEQLSLWKSTPTLNSSCDRISQEYQFTPISEITNQNQENSICYQLDSPAQAQVMQEVEQDYLTQNQHFGEKDLDVLSRLNPVSVLSNNLKELSNEDFELFLADSLWQDTLGKLAMSRQQSLVQRQRLNSQWLTVKRTGDRLTYELPDGLVQPIVPSKTPGRIRARYLAGRTVTPAQAAIALERVLYLHSMSSQTAEST